MCKHAKAGYKGVLWQIFVQQGILQIDPSKYVNGKNQNTSLYYMFIEYQNNDFYNQDGH